MIHNNFTYWNNFWNNAGTGVPWETNQPDENLLYFLKNKNFNNSLDIGCGSGINSNVISQYSNKTLGIDIADTAINFAYARFSKQNLEFKFLDFLSFVNKEKFDFVFDRGCFHGFFHDTERSIFVKNISNFLTDNGIWLSIIGSAENINNNEGPPRWKISEIIHYVEPVLHIIEVKHSTLLNKNGILSPAWVIVSQKRKKFT